jgi:hypothetical protein
LSFLKLHGVFLVAWCGDASANMPTQKTRRGYPGRAWAYFPECAIIGESRYVVNNFRLQRFRPSGPTTCPIDERMTIDTESLCRKSKHEPWTAASDNWQELRTVAQTEFDGRIDVADFSRDARRRTHSASKKDCKKNL